MGIDSSVQLDRPDPTQLDMNKSGSSGFMLTTVDQAVGWARSSSIWPMLFGLACCAIEMMSAQASRYDMARFGMELMRASPRQSDLMIVAGRLSRKMAPVLRRLYDQMPNPKYVISMGDCASCGGIFNNYAIVQGVDEIVPVDVYVAGCPPRPEALIDGIMVLQQQIANESQGDIARVGKRTISSGEYRKMAQPPGDVPAEERVDWSS